MKAIKIDVRKKEIYYIEIDGDMVDNIVNHLECDVFTLVYPNTLKKGDTLYVDDEGLLKEPIGAFSIKGCDQVLSGNGLILGTDEEGAAQDVVISIDDLKQLVSFESVDKLPEPFIEIYPFDPYDDDSY